METTHFVHCATDEPTTRCVRAACKKCHDRKVRCDSGSGKPACSNCRFYGEDCIPRERKRTRPNHMRVKDARARRMRESSHVRSSLRISTQDIDVSIGNAQSESLPPRTTFEQTTSARYSSLLSPEYEDIGETVRKPVQDGLHRAAIVCGAYSGSPALRESGPSLLDNNTWAESDQNFTVSETEYKVLEIYRATELPPIPVCQSLIEAYFEFCWTWMPVVEPAFKEIATTNELAKPNPKRPESLLLMNSMLLVGSRMRRGASQYASARTYYFRAKTLIDMGIERNPKHLMSALCMMQWWNSYKPRDVSLHSSRFWATYAIGIAQQMGLHTKRPYSGKDSVFWKRIWWTLYVRDSLISAAHGSPRIINPNDCSVERLTPQDFSPEHEMQGMIFCNYVEIADILCELCCTLTKQQLFAASKEAIGSRLLAWIQNLPDSLRLTREDGSTRSYNREVTQLHIYFLTALCIFFRSRSITAIGPDNAGAVLASLLIRRLLVSIQLRDHAIYLGAIFTWCIFVSAIPQLSCTMIPSLRDQSKNAIQDLQDILVSLETTWPSATFNLSEIHRLRDIVEATDSNRSSMSARVQEATDTQSTDRNFPEKLFGSYGTHVMEHYGQLCASISNYVQPEPSQLNTPPSNGQEEQSQGNPEMNYPRQQPPNKTPVTAVPIGQEVFDDLAPSFSTFSRANATSFDILSDSNMLSVLPDDIIALNNFDGMAGDMPWADYLAGIEC